MDYKIGDKVWIRDDLEINKEYGIATFVGRMKKGCVATIVGTDYGVYQLDDLDTSYNYTNQMIDHDKTEEINKYCEDTEKLKFKIGDFVKLKEGAVEGSQFTDYPIASSEVFTTPLEVKSYDPHDDTVYLSNDYWYHKDALEKAKLVITTAQANGIKIYDGEIEATDAVNSPSHYTTGEIETIDYIQDKLNTTEFEGYCKGNALKYISRANLKNGEEDIMKAIWYLRFMLGDDPRKDNE